MGEKVASRVAKESLLDAFWSPFGSLFGDISEDSARNLTTPFLAMPSGDLLFFVTYHSLSVLELLLGYSLSISQSSLAIP